MNTLNRQVVTNYHSSIGNMKIEVTKDITISGKKMVKGEKFEATRSEAKRLMSTSKEYLRVVLD